MLETDTAFAATRPERQCQVVDGRLDCGQACAKGTLVYRLYNDGFPERDSNHRYVSDVALYRAMQAQGWIGEEGRLCTAQ
jgi:serine protease